MQTLMRPQKGLVALDSRTWHGSRIRKDVCNNLTDRSKLDLEKWMDAQRRAYTGRTAELPCGGLRPQ
ncbi:hypothetical protein JTE90_016519 [Oedothorax gibbosus]|uniref:Uncharacterized protein n=1 Tax=Oedothorax gibbosus TaxID=931172 RepID=A0AAV6TD32_9ARAC|nr:hypothetical protein JTE90_016519 [Oedothorax gibbosus]